MTVSTQTTKPTGEKDFVTRLADAGEEALQRLAELPGGQKALTAANELRARVDDLANPGGPAVAPDGEPDERIADRPRAGLALNVRVIDLNEDVVGMQLDAARDEGGKAKEEDEDRPGHRRGCEACKT